MLSRRTILSWLAASPFMGFAAKAMPAVAAATEAPKRARKWAMVLEPDGSTALKNGDKYWLDEWLGTQKAEDWGNTENTRKASLDEVKSIIAQDREAVQERSDPWKDLKEFEDKYGIEVPMELEIYKGGQVFPQDLVESHKPIASWPAFSQIIEEYTTPQGQFIAAAPF